jgi:hypothetical protein
MVELSVLVFLAEPLLGALLFLADSFLVAAPPIEERKKGNLEEGREGGREGGREEENKLRERKEGRKEGNLEEGGKEGRREGRKGGREGGTLVDGRKEN